MNLQPSEFIATYNMVPGCEVFCILNSEFEGALDCL